MDDELDYLEHYLEEARQKFNYRRQLRELNLQENIDYSNDSRLESLDSSIKKNSAFVKKLKTFSENQKCVILDEIDRLNSTKFISEVASSLIEAKLKLSDIPSVIEICTKLNRIYKDFHKQLLDQYSKCLPTARRRANVDPRRVSSQQQQSQSPSQFNLVHLNRNLNQQNELTPSVSNISKLRVDLRLFAELLLVGILPLKDAFQLLASFLHYLMTSDKNFYQNANALLTFCKGCGDELLDLVPVRIGQLASEHQMDLPTSDYISSKRQHLLQTHMREFFHLLSRNLCDLHGELRELIAKNQKMCKSRGEINKEAKETVETRSIEFQKLQNIVVQFAEILNESAPSLAKLSELDDETVNVSENQPSAPGAQVEVEAATQNSIWDDEGARCFYEELLNLKELFPNLRVKLTASAERASEESLNKLSQSATTSPSGPPTNEKEANQGEDESNSESSSASDSEEVLIVPEKLEQTLTKSIAQRVQPDQYFSKLSNCVNRDMIDEAAIDFIKFFNTKFGRKKLVKAIFNVKRTRLDLLPFFARLTATIHPYVPNVGNDLASQLKSEFKYLFKKKDQINIESKVKNVRFIGEFVKFNLITKQDAIDCLKMLLSDFTHHHIEMTCNLLETCGRLLYKSPESHHQLKLILEQVMRKKLLLSVDSKYVIMIENAYYLTNPPEVVKQVVDEPPIQAYVRYLLYECLDRANIDKVLKKLKLLDWEDKNLAKFVINRMIEAYNVKFYNIRYFAAMLAALNKDHPWISIAVVDGVVEDILLMMEINEIQFNQRRIPMIRYFGELYNYRLTDSSLVFKILYSMITYGVNYPEPEQNLSQIPLSSADPPDNLFRIKLICDLLDTSGPHLNSCQERKKLDCFLLFFQRYYWCKRHIYMLHPFCMVKSGDQFPASVEYHYNDTIFNLRPSFQMASSYAEAIDCLQSFIDGLQVN